MIYPVYLYGSAVLRQPSQNVAPDEPGLKQFIDDLYQTMYAADGVGLAAPQVGKSWRIFVVDASSFAEGEEMHLDGFKRAFINPDIYERSGDEVLFNEGCLSLPGIHEDVLRLSHIRIRYIDEHGTEHDEAYEGTAARIIQHEYDHVEATLFVDHLSALRKTLLRSKLQALAKGIYKARYRCKVVK